VSVTSHQKLRIGSLEGKLSAVGKVAGGCLSQASCSWSPMTSSIAGYVPACPTLDWKVSVTAFGH
jgi:hypothetical protein